jgi:glycerophosphoryl diester phosphodiesterase
MRQSKPHALVISHRGGSLEAPENTLAAIRHTEAVGAPWLEIDVHITTDDEVVVIHDGRLDRTTDGEGAVEQLTLAELAPHRAGRPRFSPDVIARLEREGLGAPDFAERFPNEPIPTLASALEAAPKTRVMIEMKPTSRGEALVKGTLAAIARGGAEQRVALASFDPSLLRLSKTLAPDIPRIGLVDHPSKFEAMLDLGVHVLAAWHGLAQDALSAREAHPSKPAVWVWTIYSAKRALDLESLGVDGIITDAPAKVLESFKRRAPAES